MTDFDEKEWWNFVAQQSLISQRSKNAEYAARALARHCPIRCPSCREPMQPVDAPEGCATRYLLGPAGPASMFSCDPCKQIQNFCHCGACFPALRKRDEDAGFCDQEGVRR